MISSFREVLFYFKNKTLAKIPEFSSFLNFRVLCPFLVCNHLVEEKKAVCLAFLVLNMSYCKCSAAVLRGAMNWSAVCDCGIS